MKKTTYKIWMVIEKRTVDKDGNEKFEDIKESQMSLNEHETELEAVEEMENVYSTYTA